MRIRRFGKGFGGLALLLLLGAAPVSGAPVRFVSLDGDDSADGLTADTAWRTLAHADLAAPDSAEIRVEAGDYREGSEGLGWLRIASPRVGIRYIATGEVWVRARVPGQQVMQLDTAGDPAFVGLGFAGADSCLRVVTGTAAAAAFIECRFSGALYTGVDMTSSPGLRFESCAFGAAGAPLPAVGLRLTDCLAATVLGCRFHTVGARAVSVEHCDHLLLEDNAFGEAEQPLVLASQWAVSIGNSDFVALRGNRLFLLSGHGIGLPAGQVPVHGAEVIGNEVHALVATEQYAILVGSETLPPCGYSGVRIEENLLDLATPGADTAKHDLFIGFAQSPIVRGNTVIGGGYGLVIKDCDAAEVAENSVSGTWRYGILDKGGLNCEFHDNLVDTARGRCVRFTNDPVANRAVQGSRWYANCLRGGALPYEFSAPVTPNENFLSSAGNVLAIGEHGDPILVVNGGYQDFWTAQSAWDWDASSLLFAMDEPPVPRGDSLQVSGNHAQLRVECSEACSGWLAFGEVAPLDTVRVETLGMSLVFVLTDLTPATTYTYRYAIVDALGEQYLSEPGTLTTVPSSGAGHAEAADLRLSLVHPNPGNPGSRVTIECARSGEFELALFDARGRRVRSLVTGPCAAGRREFRLEARDDAGSPLPSGVYWVRAALGGTTACRRWVLLR